MQDYTININAPQSQRIYDWYQVSLKNNKKEWWIKGEHCSNCNLKTQWYMKFCPHCGFMIINTLNPNPPEEENE